MHYVISDIHGCYYEYLAALKKVNFNDNDTLYVLGDCIDRGNHSIKVLQDMMKRHNVIPIAGNHEYMALNILETLCVEITEHTIDSNLNLETMEEYLDWILNGGNNTIEEFRKLPLHEKYAIIDYLKEFSLYEAINLPNKNYLLLHGGLEPFKEGMNIDDFSIIQILFSKANYDTIYFHDKYTITGHTPTINQEGNLGTIIKKNNHIAIDCGCVFGYNLAIYCLETEAAFYIPYQDK